MKETNLGKFYVSLLDIAPNSEDAVRLVHWRRPTSKQVCTYIVGQQLESLTCNTTGRVLEILAWRCISH